ncbi:MAG TPA: HEAT repeat domain-containing protein [Polyangiaceae bacterium]
MRRQLGAMLGIAAAGFAPDVLAATPPAVAKAGGGQAALAVGFDARGELRAAICASEPCSVEGGTALGLPRDIKDAREKARLAIVGIGSNRRVVVVTVPTARPKVSFEAVVAAPLSGAAPLVLYAGLSGFAAGEDGERRGGMVVVSDVDAAGVRSVAVGEQQEALTLCGRPTILASQVVDARDLTLRPAKVQRLDAAERARAVKLVATRLPADAPPAPALLRAAGASSAIGNPAALTDGDPETTWAENRGGSGKGEFVVMNAPAALPLEGLEFTLRPPRATPANGAAPSELWVATSKELYSVAFPEDGWAHPGARYGVRFPAPVTSDCVAIALEKGSAERPEMAITIAEVGATTALGTSDVPSLIASLRGGGQKADHAKVLLRALGKPGFDATAAAFAGLDEGGRRVALEVLDSAPCATSAGPYVEALTGPYPAQRQHAADRLPRCGPEAAPLLEQKLKVAEAGAFQELAEHLAAVAPAESVVIFVGLMEEAAVTRRAAMRTALGRVAGTRAGAPAFRKALADPSTPEVALLDLLRAAGARAKELAPESIAALQRLSQGSGFRARYLRVGPLAELAAGDAGLKAAFEQALVADPDSRVRAAAARVVRDPKAFQTSLVRALGDADPRVRIEAAHMLAGAPDGAATPVLLGRVENDHWPMVRALSLTALGSAQRSADTDARVAGALDDASWLVRRAALGALGARGARAHAELIVERLDNVEERPEVRLVAARALGALCHTPALDTLTDYARKLADPYASGEERGIAFAALGSLRELAPADLRSRLSPLLSKNAPRGARAAAEAALADRSPRCLAKR